MSDHGAREALEVGRADGAHVPAQRRLQQLDDALYTVSAIRRETPHHRPRHEHGLGAEHERFQHVGAAPEAAVDQDGRLAADEIRDPGSTSIAAPLPVAAP